MLLQTLDAARSHSAASSPAPCPRAALELAASLVAAFCCHAPPTATTGTIPPPPSSAPELSIALSSPAAAVRCLPYTLPRLLSRHPWSSSCEAVAQALLALAGDAVRAGKLREGAGCGRGEEQGHGEGERAVVACLWALRDVLPPYTYDQVHGALPWYCLAA